MNITSLTHPTTLAKIRNAVKEAITSSSAEGIMKNGKGMPVLCVRYNRFNKEVSVLNKDHKDVTSLVRAAFKATQAIVNKHMAVCLDNEIACPVRMTCVH